MSTQPPTSSIGNSFLVDQIQIQAARTPAVRRLTWLAPVLMTGVLLGAVMLALGDRLAHPLGFLVAVVVLGLGLAGSRAGIDVWLRAYAKRTPLAQALGPALARVEAVAAESNDRDAIALALREEITAALHPDAIEFTLYDPRNDSYRDEATGETLSPTDPLVTWLLSQPLASPIVLSLSEQPAVVELLRERGIDAIVSLGRSGWLALRGPHGEDAYGEPEQSYLYLLCHAAAAGLQQAALVHAQQQRAEELQALYWIAQAVTFSIDPDDLMELIYTQLKRVMRVPNFYVALQDPDTQRLSFSFYIEDEERLYSDQTWSPDEGLTSVLLKNNLTLRTDDYVEECKRRGCEPKGPRLGHAWMGTALTAGDRSIGVMVASAFSADLKFTQTEENIFVTVATYTAAILERQALYQRLAARAQQLATLNEIGGLLASSLDLDEVLDLVVRHAAALLNCEAGSLLLLDEDVGDLVFRTSSGPTGKKLIGQRVPAGKGIAGAAFAENRPVISQDPRQDARWYASLDAQSDFVTQSVIAVPLNTRGRTIGALEVLNRRGLRPFKDEDSELLMSFAAQAAVAIENARLFTTTDQALQARVEELTTLQYIDRQLNASLDTRAVMEQTLEWALRITRASIGIVASLQQEEEATGLRILAHKGYREEKLAPHFEDALWPLDQGLMGRTVRLGKTTLVNDVAHDASYCGIEPDMAAQLTVPIRRESRVIGVIALETTDPEGFHQEHITAIERLADHAAIAIDNARLFDQLQQANDAKTEFVSFVSHELKQPMTSMKGYADLLTKGVGGELNSQQKNFVTVIRNNVERMDRMVQDLLDVSRIEAGRLKLEMEPLDPAAMTREAIAAFEQEIAAKEQKLHIEIPESLPEIQGDRGRLIQILTNLISNANKYTPRGGNIAVRAEVVSSDSTSSLRWQVIDDGIGMGEDEIQQLFTKYFRSKNPSVRSVQGTGLGLVITRSIVEMHGGKISVQSVREVGSTFSFEIPLARTG